MLKILIVDDEAIIREGMRSFPWQEHGCEIVGLADDGEEALIMTRLLHPDIIISDIRMPGMDGLTLAEQLKKEHPAISIILLTGFDDVDYIKQALHLHVDEYLLKPADFAELGTAIDRIAKQLLIRKNRDANYQRLNKQISAALPVLRATLFMHLTNGHFNSEEQAEHSLALFDIPIGNYVVISTHYTLRLEESMSANVKENWMLSFSVTATCQELFSKYAVDTLSFDSYRSIFFLLIFPEQISTTDCMSAVQMATHKIKKKLKEDLDINLAFGISNMGTHLMDISELYYQADSALTQCYFFSDNPTLFYSDIHEATQEELYIPIAKREYFTDAIKTGNQQAVEQYVDFLLPPHSLHSAHNISQYKHRVISELFYAAQIVDEENFIQALGDGKSTDFTTPILNCHSLEHLHETSLRLFLAMISGKKGRSAAHYDSTAEKIIQYIREHYHENISLDILADQFHFSPTYISRLIRRSQGVNFTEILSETRLSEAKRLLKDNIYRVEDIGRMVGYNDTSYFIQSFKKRYEVTPNEYRNMFNF